MTRYSITASYGPQFTWGAPEANLEQILGNRGIKISGTEAGTDLQTGRRDVELIVDPAEQAGHLQFPEALHEAIDALVQTAERRLWVILPTDDATFDFTSGYGPKLSLVTEAGPTELDELATRVGPGPETKVEFRVLVDGRQLGREYDDVEDAVSALDVINRVRERDRAGEPARIEARLVGTWQAFDVQQPTPDRS